MEWLTLIKERRREREEWLSTKDRRKKMQETGEQARERERERERQEREGSMGYREENG